MNAPNIAVWCFLVFAIIVLLYAFMVLWKIYKGEISLSGLLAESPPPEAYRAVVGAIPNAPNAASAAAPPTLVFYTKASLARFQFLIFTFVIAGLFLLLSIEAGTFVDVPTNVLGLMGISGGTYVVGKVARPPAAAPAVAPVAPVPPPPPPA